MQVSIKVMYNKGVKIENPTWVSGRFCHYASKNAGERQRMYFVLRDENEKSIIPPLYDPQHCYTDSSESVIVYKGYERHKQEDGSYITYKQEFRVDFCNSDNIRENIKHIDAFTEPKI